MIQTLRPEGTASLRWSHVLAHKMGVIDEEYVRKTQDTDAVVGHKIRLSKHSDG